jgi:hypothetical protein
VTGYEGLGAAIRAATGITIEVRHEERNFLTTWSVCEHGEERWRVSVSDLVLLHREEVIMAREAYRQLEPKIEELFEPTLDALADYWAEPCPT